MNKGDYITAIATIISDFRRRELPAQLDADHGKSAELNCGKSAIGGNINTPRDNMSSCLMIMHWNYRLNIDANKSLKILL